MKQIHICAVEICEEKNTYFHILLNIKNEKHVGDESRAKKKIDNKHKSQYI